MLLALVLDLYECDIAFMASLCINFFFAFVVSAIHLVLMDIRSVPQVVRQAGKCE